MAQARFLERVDNPGLELPAATRIVEIHKRWKHRGGRQAHVARLPCDQVTLRRAGTGSTAERHPRKPRSQVRKRQTDARAQDQKALVRQKESTGQARKIGEDKGSEASQSTWRRDQETKLASQAPYLSQSKVRGRNLPVAAVFMIVSQGLPAQGKGKGKEPIFPEL